VFRRVNAITTSGIEINGGNLPVGSRAFISVPRRYSHSLVCIPRNV
jgi:hypothetical protein